MIKDLVKANRSYRGFDETRKITKSELVNLIELARLCPSAVNAQPLKYYIAYEKELVDKVQKTTKWAMALPKLTLPYEGMRPTAFIVICQDLSIDSSLQKFQKDVGIVAQTILLGAVEMGLGGCMIGNFSAHELKSSIGLKEDMQPLLVVAIGKPNEAIVIVDTEKGESTKYYRDENDVHYVPKRKLEDILLNN